MHHDPRTTGNGGGGGVVAPPTTNHRQRDWVVRAHRQPRTTAGEGFSNFDTCSASAWLHSTFYIELLPYLHGIPTEYLAKVSCKGPSFAISYHVPLSKPVIVLVPFEAPRRPPIYLPSDIFRGDCREEAHTRRRRDLVSTVFKRLSLIHI